MDTSVPPEFLTTNTLRSCCLSLFPPGASDSEYHCLLTLQLFVMLNLPEIQQKNKVFRERERERGWFFFKNFADSRQQMMCWWPWKPQRNLMEEEMGGGERRERGGEEEEEKGEGGETDEKATTTVCFLLLLWEGIRYWRCSLVTS